MHYSRRLNLISFLLICTFYSSPVSSQNIHIESVSKQLEKSLNKKNLFPLKNLFTEESFNKFEKQYERFTKNYKEIEWSINPKNEYKIKKYLDVRITSKRFIGGLKYYLDSRQTIKLETNSNFKITGYRVLNEESILKSYDKDLEIQVNSPQKVSTGERYHFDLIIETPIDNSFITGEMIALKNSSSNKQLSIPFKMKPKLSGGLFKSITAPLQSGSQIISAIIVHQKGVFTVTKKIEVD